MKSRTDWGKKWRRCDEAKLERLAGVEPVSTLCVILKRSEHSIRAKARMMELDLRLSPYWFTAGELAHAVGVKHHTVNSWVRKGLLPTSTPGKALFTIQQIKLFFDYHQHLPSLSRLQWDEIESNLLKG